MSNLSYANGGNGAWQTFLAQVDRVAPYLSEDLADYVDTLKRPKRALIVDVPIIMDDGSIQHFEGYRVRPQPFTRAGQRRYPLPSRCRVK